MPSSPETVRALRAAIVAAGVLCPRCRTRKRSAGRLHCWRCLRAKRVQQARRSERLRVAAMHERGEAAVAARRVAARNTITVVSRGPAPADGDADLDWLRAAAERAAKRSIDVST